MDNDHVYIPFEYTSTCWTLSFSSTLLKLTHFWFGWMLILFLRLKSIHQTFTAKFPSGNRWKQKYIWMWDNSGKNALFLLLLFIYSCVALLQIFSSTSIFSHEILFLKSVFYIFTGILMFWILNFQCSILFLRKTEIDPLD